MKQVYEIEQILRTSTMAYYHKDDAYAFGYIQCFIALLCFC